MALLLTIVAGFLTLTVARVVPRSQTTETEFVFITILLPLFESFVSLALIRIMLSLTETAGESSGPSD